MGMFTKVSSTAFASIQTNAGMLLNSFNPENPAAPTDGQIICMTTGGINPSCAAEYTDFGEDIDNVPNNTKELKRLNSWTCTLSTTAYDTTPELIKLALGAADITGTNTKIVPRRELKNSDFSDIWWVGDRLDGGWVAIRLVNALSTDGFSIQTTKDGKGTIPLTLTGHVSIHDQDTMPMEFYVSEGGSVSLNKHIETITGTGTKTLTATVKPTGTTVTWTSSNTSVATVSGGTVTGVSAGTAVITASVTVNGVTASDSCTVTVSAGA